MQVSASRLRPVALSIHLALAGLAGTTLSALPCAAHAQTATHHDIPAGALGPALSRFAAEAGIALGFDPALAAGRQTAGLKGSFTVDDAFLELLRGTGLQAARQPDGGYVLARPTMPSEARTLSAVVVQASADASAAGLAESYAGEQVARGSRLGILGNRDIMETPFSTTAYTSQLIQNQQARSVADVVQNDPTVRIARGFGNFQELYVMRGFPVPSDDMTYNGLYGVLPRQYVAAELLERVEIFRGASSFINGGVGVASGFGVGGTVNALPKRAPSDPLTQLTVGIDEGGQYNLSADLARRFGPDERFGVRINAAHRDGESTIDREDRQLDLIAVGADYRGDHFRMSADIGYQNHRLDTPRPSVTPTGSIPSAPDGDTNYGQDWSFTAERQTFATLRGEFDLNERISAWAALGLRNGKEENALTNLQTDGVGNTLSYRFDNVREDRVRTGEVGLRGQFETGTIKHTLVISAAAFDSESHNAYAFGDWGAQYAGNLYRPFPVAIPAPSFYVGGDMDAPKLTERITTSSVAVADTLAMFDERLLLTIGARRQRIGQKNYNYTTGARESHYEDRATTPMAGIVFRLTPQVSLYTNYIEGLTKGETPPWYAINTGQSLPAHVSKQREVGIKYDGGALGGTLSLFEVERPFGIVGADNVFREGGEQRNRGIELSAFGEPLRGLRLLGGVTLLQAKLVEAEDQAHVGQRAVGVPKTQASVGIEWDIPGVRGLTLTGRAIHTSAQYADAANTQEVPSWSRLDLGARYTTEIAEQVVTFRARLDNATDRDYWVSTGGYPGYGYLVLGAPRTLTLSATVEF